MSVANSISSKSEFICCSNSFFFFFFFFFQFLLSLIIIFHLFHPVHHKIIPAFTYGRLCILKIRLSSHFRYHFQQATLSQSITLLEVYFLPYHLQIGGVKLMSVCNYLPFQKYFTASGPSNILPGSGTRYVANTSNKHNVSK